MPSKEAEKLGRDDLDTLVWAMHPFLHARELPSREVFLAWADLCDSIADQFDSLSKLILETVEIWWLSLPLGVSESWGNENNPARQAGFVFRFLAEQKPEDLNRVHYELMRSVYGLFFLVWLPRKETKCLYERH